MKNKPECRIPSDKTIREVCSHLVESSEAAQIIGVTQPSVLRYVEGGEDIRRQGWRCPAAEEGRRREVREGHARATTHQLLMVVGCASHSADVLPGTESRLSSHQNREIERRSPCSTFKTSCGKFTGNNAKVFLTG